MSDKGLILLALTVCSALPAAQPQLQLDPPKKCFDCVEWNAPREPFRIFGNTYYVGVAQLSVLLVATDAGLILLDGALPQSVPLIDANIRKLGFRTEDVRFILNSHAHYDHAGGIAALQRVSGARVVASAAGARALERGEPTADDPQYGLGRQANEFPAITAVQTVTQGETVKLGAVSVTAHMTPGHTPGSTTWAWRSCEGSRCLDIVYADSVTAVSADGFRFTGGPGRPDVGNVFRQSIEKVGALPCDIIVSTHPSATNLEERLKRRAAGASDALVDPGACRAYAGGALERLEARIAEEKGG
jgi:metallo-beta-lactamase class B